MTQKELERIRKLYTIKFPVGYQYSQARDDVHALLTEIERLQNCQKAYENAIGDHCAYCEECEVCKDRNRGDKSECWKFDYKRFGGGE